MLIVKRNPKILLIIPPLMQFNSPYPSIPILTAFLRSRGYDASQTDSGLELILRLFSQPGLHAVNSRLRQSERSKHPSVLNFISNFKRYADTIDEAVLFLQNNNPGLAARIITRSFLPEGPRFETLKQQPPADLLFGESGSHDHAKHLASLYIDDIADVIRIGVDERFELSRYAEKLTSSLPNFAPLKTELEKPPTLIDQMIDEMSESLMKTYQPDLIGFTIPFPGNLYASLRMARAMKKVNPTVKIVMGGGYINTELRSLKDPGIFDFADFITLDDGEIPLLQILRSLYSSSKADLVRTFTRDAGEVVFHDTANYSTPPSVTPVFDGMSLERRISMMELPNPMYRLWSDGGWNKLMLAHGCYWHRCSFCDTTLDYIGRYRHDPAEALVDRMESIAEETGQSGFHFVDEAAPPPLLRKVAKEILRRKLQLAWWCNIRFEKSFTPALASLLADAGCIAVTGGLETVCNRTLKIMKKGVTVEQAVCTAAHFAASGIMIHAYLMYGFPSQTAAETVDALEIVRQMFDQGCLQSAYWHRFALTTHSLMAASPAEFGIQLTPGTPALFAQNEIAYKDLSKIDPESLATGLRKAVYNFMHGVGIEADIRTWFDLPTPRPRVRRKFVRNLIS